MEVNYYKFNHLEYLNLPDFFRINKYNVGASMGNHVDSEDPASNNNPPLLSAVLYLNDEYIGGEISFIKQNIKLKPKPGSFSWKYFYQR